MRALVLSAIVLGAFLAPALLSLDTADACRPMSWICPLNGQWYHTCGHQLPPPLVVCAQDALRDASLPPLP